MVRVVLHVISHPCWCWLSLWLLSPLKYTLNRPPGPWISGNGCIQFGDFLKMKIFPHWMDCLRAQWSLSSKSQTFSKSYVFFIFFAQKNTLLPPSNRPEKKNLNNSLKSLQWRMKWVKRNSWSFLTGRWVWLRKLMYSVCIIWCKRHHKCSQMHCSFIPKGSSSLLLREPYYKEFHAFGTLGRSVG